MRFVRDGEEFTLAEELCVDGAMSPGPTEESVQ